MKNQRKQRRIFKRLMSGVSALALSVGLLGSIPASADDSNIGYKYTLFAYSSEEGAITSSAANFCVNGNIATNGTISAGQNFNVNGEKKEHANETMPDLSKAINEKFFAENVDVKAENYSKNETNIEVKVPTDVKGKAELNGNIKLAAGVKAMGDISFAGGVLNNDSTVLFSENGSININSENVSLTGLIYAPKGNIVIESKSLNLNSVVMIANKITLNAPNININSNAEMAKFVQEAIDKNGSSGGNEDPEPVTDPVIYAYGEYNEKTKSVDIEWYSNLTGEFAVLESLNGTDYTVVSKVSNDTKYSIKVTSDSIKKYFKVSTIKDGKTIESIPFSIVNANGKYSTELLDTDTDGLADLYEEMLGTDKTVPDTDKDGLTDYEEAYITNTDPTKYDSVTEGVSDADADNDKDGLSNKREIELKTNPNSDDTDGDNLKDGDEVSKYKTDPTKRDTDEDDLEDDDEFKFNCDPNKKDTDNNGIIDGKEKHQQTVDVVPDNKEQAVSKVSVSMSATGNIEKTTTVESIMNKDMLCSRVVGLVGEPFSIESSSSFDNATITFTVDKAKLGETKFDDLMFLWYDRENDNFVELDTTQDAANSTVSIETTHFSDYMIVDSAEWWHNWERIYEDIQKFSSGTPKTSSRAVSLVFQCTSNGDPDFINPDPDNTIMSHYTNYRTLISDYLIASMSDSDMLSFVNMYQTGYVSSRFSGDKDRLKDSIEPYINQIFKSPSYSNDTYRDSTLGLYVLSTEIKRECPDKETKSIVYITDHDVFIDDAALRNRYPNISPDIGKDYKSVPVYFVCVGAFGKTDLDKTSLKKIASETDGKVYSAVTLNDFYTDPKLCLVDAAPKDTDGDGFTDAEETYGLIVDSSGTRYKTDPKSKHSDNDGLEDNKEIEVSRVSVETKDDKGNTVWKCYHHMKSDPTNPDTDGDLDNDNIDPHPNNYQLNDCFISKLQELQSLAKEFNDHIENESERIKKQNVSKYTVSKEYWYVFMFIRQFNSLYTKDNWSLAGGSIETEFIEYVKSKDATLYEYFNNTTDIYANNKKESLDLRHFAATMTVYIYHTSFGDDVPSMLVAFILLYNGEKYNKTDLLPKGGLMPEKHIDNLGGWAGDLQTVMNDAWKKTENRDDPEEIYTKLTSLIGKDNQDSSFSQKDLYADIDAHNIYSLLQCSSLIYNSNCISNPFSDYYSYLYKKRFSIFVNDKELQPLDNVSLTYTRSDYLGISGLKWPLLNMEYDLGYSMIACKAFVDEIEERVINESKNV